MNCITSCCEVPWKIVNQLLLKVASFRMASLFKKNSVYINAQNIPSPSLSFLRMKIHVNNALQSAMAELRSLEACSNSSAAVIPLSGFLPPA